MGGRKSFVRDKGLAHTKKNCQQTEISYLKKIFEHTELPAELLLLLSI